MENKQKGCQNCGGIVKFSPKTSSLNCDYCGHQNTIKQIGHPKGVKVFELASYQKEVFDASQIETLTVKCSVCSAETTLGEKLTSKSCPFCGNPLVLKQSHVKRLHKPHYVLPFAITDDEALISFQKWIQGLWFAPSMLKKRKLKKDKFRGVYLPCWAYDCETVSDYKGKRGDNRTRWTTDSNGNRTSETYTSWRKKQGTVKHNFKNILIFGTNSIPQDDLNFSDWRLSDLQPYNPNFLLGFETEIYEWTLRQGYNGAKVYMVEAIRGYIKRDIGGDHQTISWVSTEYGTVYFKLMLLPVWISAYRFRGKIYQIIINGKTGEVNGKRPFSWIKIASVILAVTLPLFYFFSSEPQTFQVFLANLIENIPNYYNIFLNYFPQSLSKILQ